MSFRDLLRGSESGRKQRARTDVNVRPMRVTTIDGNEAWTFSYKSSPSTTGIRWKGYINFLKKDVLSKDSAEDLDCQVDCECPDFRFRYAYNDAQAGASITGPNSLNQNNGKPPRPRNQGGVGDYGVGMCKHLIALGKYLRTQISPEAPEPEDEPPMPKEPVKKQTLPPAKAPQTSKAPDPEDTYSDSRTGSDTLQEYALPQPQPKPPGYKSELYKRLEEFVKTNPEFDVQYEDESD
jgi:hypothetical protein